MTKKFGFTLAEVLITLVIIGVIAAMTIPTLMSNTNQQENKTAFKKAISTLNQAITMQYALSGESMDSFAAAAGDIRSLSSTGFASFLSSRMQIVNTNTAGAQSKRFNKTTSNHTYYLSDGMAIELPSTKTCAANASTGCLFTMVVDVNGDKGTCTTATYGATTVGDCFPVNIYKDGARPANDNGKKVLYGGL